MYTISTNLMKWLLAYERKKYYEEVYTATMILSYFNEVLYNSQVKPELNLLATYIFLYYDTRRI